MKIRTIKYRSIDALVVTALLCAALSIPAAKPEPEPDPWLLQACVGLIIIVVGGCVTIKMANFCDSRFPRTNNIPRTNSTRITMQGSANMTDWTTVFETNCCLEDFEYRPDTNSPLMFYRAVFP